MSRANDRGSEAVVDLSDFSVIIQVTQSYNAVI